MDQFRKPKILLVDDSMLFLEFEKSILGPETYSIVEAYNGKTGLEVARREKPDLILLDVNMPVMNGFEFLLVSRNDDRLKDIPVIIITTKGRETDVKYALKLGADDFITKPIDDQSLVQKVNSFLDFDPRRNFPRIAIDLEIEITDFEQSFYGTIKDLGRGGVLVQTPVQIALNREVELRFALPFEGGSRKIRTFGKVVSLNPINLAVGEATTEIRIQFINLSRNHLYFIDNLINRDTESIASFLLTGPRQRKDHLVKVDQVNSAFQEKLASTLEMLMEDLYRIETGRPQLLEKFELLKTHLMESQLEFHELGRRAAQLEEAYQALSSLFVSSYQLHGKDTLSGVVTVMSDILENLVGAEKFDIILVSSQGDTAVSLMNRRRLPEDHPFLPMVRAVVRTGSITLTDPAAIPASGSPEPPLALVPLQLANRSIGCIILLGVVPQNYPLSHTSLQLLELLQHQAGSAIFAAGCHRNRLGTAVDFDNIIEELSVPESMERSRDEQPEA